MKEFFHEVMLVLVTSSKRETDMNIWVEYFRSTDKRSHIEGSHAQMKEQAKWVEPDPKDVHKRFCQNREDANRFAKSMQDQGYHATIKTDKSY